ncbi:MAG: adenylyl-sulfate kinase [Pirellulales bacterium]|nr:adenylyl-sulfate kinase [Pirellulales bacterium]
MSQVNVTWHEHHVKREPGCVVWFTGLSGSGKSTVANIVDHKLNERGVASFLLDGDNVRHGLNASPEMLRGQHGDAFAERFGLGFAAEDREENIRRIGAVSELFCSAGIVTLVAFVSPYRSDRNAVRRVLPEGRFIEVFVDAPLEVCEERDPKGLYKKARAGEIKGFTGIDDPYEPPENAELVLAAGERSPDALAEDVVALLESRSLITKL